MRLFSYVCPLRAPLTDNSFYLQYLVYNVNYFMFVEN
jgi:hypothetical protein